MKTTAEELEGRAPFPEARAQPQVGGKWQAVRLVRALHRELGLSERACRALEIIAMPTREEDWYDPHPAPICYRRKSAMAAELGVSDRQFYSIERQLERAGLLERRLMRNGWRGTSDGGKDAGASGLCLAPLVHRAHELAALNAQRKAEQKAHAALRVMVRVAWGQLARRLARDDPCLRACANDLAPPRSETFAKWSLDALRRRLTNLQGALAQRAADTRNTAKTSDASEADFRCHTKATYNSESVNCTDAEKLQAVTIPMTEKIEAESVDEARRLEAKRPADPRRRRAANIAVTVGLLARIASPELRFYLDGLRCRNFEHAEGAIAFRLRELGIAPSAYQEARTEMGVDAAVLATAVVDRNRFHPRTPVRNPGAVLRAMARLHRIGALDLAASVSGILRRDQSQPATSQ